MIIQDGFARWVLRVVLALALAGCIALFCYWQNNGLVVTRLTYSSKKIPQGFDGYTIVQISDLHNKRFGARQDWLAEAVERLAPSCIVVTGDLIDRRRFDLEAAMEFIGRAVEIAPVYFVEGNHEAWSGRYPQVRERLVGAGVTVLDDAWTELSAGGDTVRLFGLSEPDLESYSQVRAGRVKEHLADWADGAGFRILLSHRPELDYSQYRMDLIFLGHAHGGQFRFPGLGGLYAPNQGFFPKYTSGRYEVGESALIVSRGLGNSLIPLRLFNRPEIIALTLKAEG